jgi:hypothetical protein
MKIETTISCIIGGECLFEADVTCEIDHHRDRYGELEWHVDQYIIVGTRRKWDDMAQTWKEIPHEVAVPDKLADVLDIYLDREKIEAKIHENLADYGDDYGDYLRDLAMDR